MKLYLEDRPVTIEDYEFDPDDGYTVLSAYFEGGAGEDLTEEQCQELQDLYAEDLYQNGYENACAAAEDAYDSMQDR